MIQTTTTSDSTTQKITLQQSVGERRRLEKIEGIDKICAELIAEGNRQCSEHTLTLSNVFYVIDHLTVYLSIIDRQLSEKDPELEGFLNNCLQSCERQHRDGTLNVKQILENVNEAIRHQHAQRKDLAETITGKIRVFEKKLFKQIAPQEIHFFANNCDKKARILLFDPPAEACKELDYSQFRSMEKKYSQLKELGILNPALEEEFDWYKAAYRAALKRCFELTPQQDREKIVDVPCGPSREVTPEWRNLDPTNVHCIDGKNYQIQQEIGQGSNGTVYLAIDLDERKKVAIKIIECKWEKLANPALNQEVAAMKRIRDWGGHSNLVSYIASKNIDERLWIVMDYIEGSSVNAWISANKEKKPFFKAQENNALEFLTAIGIRATGWGERNMLVEKGTGRLVAVDLDFEVRP